jgi:hypothetical protein
MITDKVRVNIYRKAFEHIDDKLYPNGLWLANIPHPVNGSIMAENWVYPDRDNWIDITLPEEIDGETKFKVCISYTDKWKAKMRMKPEGWNSKNIVGRNRIYELQVMVY